MAHSGPGLCTSERRAAGVPEQIQHGNGPARFADGPAHPFPVWGMFREDAGVLERRGPDLKTKPAVIDAPFLRNRGGEFPAPVAALADKRALGAAPGGRVRFFPERLGIGPTQDDLSVALQLFAPAAVKQGILGRWFGDEELRVYFHGCESGLVYWAQLAACKEIGRRNSLKRTHSKTLSRSKTRARSQSLIGNASVFESPIRKPWQARTASGVS